MNYTEIIQQYYLAYFGRAADTGGLALYLGRVNDADEADVDAVLAGIRSEMGSASQPEFAAIYGEDVSDADFFDRAYANILNRAADAEGAEYWIGVLEANAAWYESQGDSAADAAAKARADVLSQLINAALDDDAAPTDKATFANKTAAAIYITESLDGLSEEEANEVLDGTKELLADAAIGEKTEAELEGAVDGVVEDVTGEGEGEPGETVMLTEAMAELDAANADKADFAKELDLNGDGKADGLTAATVSAAVNGDYSTKAGAVGTEVSDAAGFAARSATVQDQMIADKKAALNTDLTKAANKAEAGTAALLEAVNEEIETANAAYEADAKDADAYTEEQGVFKGLNGNPALGSADGEWYFNGDKFGISDGSDGFQAGKVYAEKVGGVWKLTADGTSAGVKRIEDLAAKYEAAEAAAAAKAAAVGALADAVEAVYLNENGGYSADSTTLGAAISYNAGTETYEVDYTKLVDIYKTADDADAGAGQAQEFSFKIGTAGEAGDKFEFAGETINFASGGAVDTDTANTAALQATAIKGLLDGGANDVSADWTVTVVDIDVLKFVAKANEANIATAQMPKATGTLAIAEQAGGKDGVAPGALVDALGSDAPLSKAVNDAQTAIDGFDKAVAEFEAIRDIKGDLAELDQAITDATGWFADNGYAAPVILADTDSKNATNKSDVFLLSDLDGSESAAIGKFGDKEVDYLFVGEGYKLVDLGTKAITANVGDQAELEIFYKQSGSDLTLYVETEAFGGNLTAGAATNEIVEITLVGKTIDDITLDGSFITAGA